LKRYYREYGDGIIDESIESSDFIGYDKYGRRKSKRMEGYLSTSLRPRNLL